MLNRQPSKIKEVVFEIDKDWAQICRLMPRLHHKDRDKYRYVHSVFIDGEQLQPIFSYCVTNLDAGQGIGENALFSQCLKHYAPKTLFECIFFVDVYRECCTNLELHMKEIYLNKEKIQKCEGVDIILKDSDGVLIWDYQLDNLIRLFKTDLLKIRDFYEMLNLVDMVSGFRRGILSGKMLFVELSGRLMVNSQKSLYDILSERMLISKTVEPNIEGGYNLFCALN